MRELRTVIRKLRRKENRLDNSISQSMRDRAGRKPTSHCRKLQRKKAKLQNARKRLQKIAR